MKLLRTARWFLMALLLSVIPASSYAGVFISVGFAPPMLPVYEQPLCPQPGLMWTPGYWAYGEDGDFWVPGAWVPAPYEGALWTPGYWGWSGGLFVFHEGYWGRHVGYYGGVNYGFGYMGIGFVGGMWRGHEFAYNTAVMHVDGRYIHSTYEDRVVVDRYTVARASHVAFSGGPGGIQHQAGPEERIAEHEQHQFKTSYQAQHELAARGDRMSFVKNNGGHPARLAEARPLAAETRPVATMQRQAQPETRPMAQPESRGYPAPRGQARPAVQGQQRPMAPQMQSRPATQGEQHPAAQQHPAPQPHGGSKGEGKEKEK